MNTGIECTVNIFFIDMVFYEPYTGLVSCLLDRFFYYLFSVRGSFFEVLIMFLKPFLAELIKAFIE